MTIIEDRINQPITLKSGAHSPDSGEMCLLEAVAWIAGEPWTDRPECVDPVLGAFGRSWNDSLNDEDRDRLLLPFLPRLVGTRSTPDARDRRAFMAADWAVRVFTPAWLRLAKLDEHAEALEGLPELDSVEVCRAAKPAIEAAGAAARDAAVAAARDAAVATARDAAGAATRAAAGDAAWAAAGAAAGGATWDTAWAATRDAAGDAAWAAAGAAAWAAARDAARDALAPTVEVLQASAVDLFDRMIEAS
jgi:hypothetical protein